MIGKLNEKVIFQSAVKTNDGGGGFGVTWQNVDNVPEVYASVTPLSTGEVFNFSKLDIKASHRVVVRYREDISPEMRVVFSNKNYDIKSVQDMQGLKRFLEIIVKEEE